MTSDESYKQPVFINDNPGDTAEQTFARYAAREFPGRAWKRLPDGGYQLDDGVRVYRVTLYGPMSAAWWGVYIDYDAMKETA